MAIKSRYNVVPMGDNINIVQPKSGTDILLETLSEYASPENRRADARLELAQRQASDNNRRQDEMLSIRKEQAKTAREEYLEGKKRREAEDLMTGFNLVASGVEKNEAGFKTLEDHAAKYLSVNNNAYDLAMQTVQALRSNTERENTEIDNIGNFFSESIEGFQYEDTIHRDLFRNNPEVKKRFISESLDKSFGTGILDEGVKMAYETDLSVLGGLLTSYTQALGDDQKAKALATLKSAYKPFIEKYGQYGVGSAAMEGLVGYESSPDIETDLKDIEKVEDDENQGNLSSTILDLIGGVAQAAPGGSTAVGLARRLPVDDILDTLQAGAKNIYENIPTYARGFAGAPIQTRKEGGKIMSKKEMYMQRRKNKK